MKYPTEPRWLIESIPQADSAWKRIVVIAMHANDRSHYQLSHDGQRFARSTDLQRLCDQYPTVAEEITAWLEAA